MKKHKASDVACGFPTILICSFLFIGLMSLLVFFGVPLEWVERAMIVLSIPWFVFLYFLCSFLGRIEIRII